MDISKLADKFLNALYLKSKNSFVHGFEDVVIKKLLEIDDEESENVKNYLRKKGLLEGSRHKGDNSVVLSSGGIDHVEKQRDSKTYKTIRFLSSQQLPPTSRASFDFLYYYDLIHEDNRIERKSIVVSISDILSMSWGYNLHDLEKILLQYAKEKVIEKVKDGTLNDYEELIMLTRNYPDKPNINPSNLIDTENAEYEVEIGKPLNIEIKENKLAASIIEKRDIINALFSATNGEKLLLLDQERNLLDFFRSAKNEVEYFHRVASLGQTARNINASILRKLLCETNTSIGPVALLDKFLVSKGKQNKDITNILKHIGYIRKGYPIHGDNIKDVLVGYKYFELKYPVENFENTWTTLLNKYLLALRQLYEIFASIYAG